MSFPLREVAYALGFHLNLFSVDRAASSRIFFRGTDYLLEELDSSSICRLNRKSRVYLSRLETSTSDGMPANLKINSTSGQHGGHIPLRRHCTPR